MRPRRLRRFRPILHPRAGMRLPEELRTGRVEQLGWPRVDVRYESGTRIPTGATIACTTPAGESLVFEVESKLAVPIHVGGGYGGDSDWLHGTWKGAGFSA